MEVIWRAGIEEEMMIERFGDQYRAFMQETGRFMPGLIR
jgi:protein-S-isoprenylcysteine O-methyltransferase Ste14